jgi:hypothetical protein
MMSHMSDELPQWLSEQLDEDEDEARRLYPSEASVRLLREVEAKRQILNDLEAAEHEMDRAARDRDTVRYNEVRVGWTALKRVVRRLAGVYDQRPGYREEWRS